MQAKTERMTSTRVPWWMVVVGATFVGMHALLAFVLIWGPAEVEGVQAAFEDGAMRLQTLEAYTYLARVGLVAGDRVLTIDGQPIRSPRDWIAAEANMELLRPQ